MGKSGRLCWFDLGGPFSRPLAGAVPIPGEVWLLELRACLGRSWIHGLLALLAPCCGSARFRMFAACPIRRRLWSPGVLCLSVKIWLRLTS